MPSTPSSTSVSTSSLDETPAPQITIIFGLTFFTFSIDCNTNSLSLPTDLKVPIRLEGSDIITSGPSNAMASASCGLFEATKEIKPTSRALFIVSEMTSKGRLYSE